MKVSRKQRTTLIFAVEDSKAPDQLLGRIRKIYKLALYIFVSVVPLSFNLIFFASRVIFSGVCNKVLFDDRFDKSGKDKFWGQITLILSVCMHQDSKSIWLAALIIVLPHLKNSLCKERKLIFILDSFL